MISYPDDDLYHPMNVHIATPTGDLAAECGEKSSCLQIMWIQKAVDHPEVKMGLKASKLSKLDTKGNGMEISKLSSTDFCGQQYGLPAGTSGYFDTGYMITVYARKLKPDTTYYYQFSDFVIFCFILNECK